GTDPGKRGFSSGISFPEFPGFCRRQHNGRIVFYVEKRADLLHPFRRLKNKLFVWHSEQCRVPVLPCAKNHFCHLAPVTDAIIGGERSQLPRFFQSDLGGENRAWI